MTTCTKTEPKTETSIETQRFVAPPVEISETKQTYTLEADMPGVSKDGLEIRLEGNELTIIGRRNPVTTDGETLYRESTAHDFKRSFELDPTIDRSKISARINGGVLIVDLPKAEEVKPRRIEVAG